MAEEEEPEGWMKKATGGIPTGKWELPRGLALVKDKTYGVDLFVEYVTVNLGPRGKMISIEWDSGLLFDYRQMHDTEEEAVESEIESLLEETDIIPLEEKDDEGKMIKLTDEEREDRARDLANQSELEYGFEVLNELAQKIGDDEQMQPMFLKQVYTFWSEEGWRWESSPKKDIDWLQPGEEEFLETVREATGRIIVEEGETPSTLKAYALAVRDIMDRLAGQDFMATFRKVIPIWSYMRLKYQLKDKASREAMSPTKLEESKDRLNQMRYWLRAHKTEMHDAARRMLDKTEAAAPAPRAAKKGKQMTVEMKRAKVKLMQNPDITDDLADYYHAVGTDPEVPVDWLMSQGATPEQIAEAADRLVKADRIDPPDYWAITAALHGADYHVGVARGNPTANGELAAHKKLLKAVREKHGELPDEVDDLFRRLKARHKGKTDSEIMDMVKDELGLKKRKNPLFKNAKEALKDALKRLTTIEVVEYKPYEAPAPPPTLEQSLESLEKTAREVVGEEEGKEDIKAVEDLSAEALTAEWKAMFEKEVREHPTLPPEVVKTIVDDHMKFKTGLDALGRTDDRENPSKQDKVIEAFWKEEEARGPKVTPMTETGTMAERRDEVTLGGERWAEVGGENIVNYLLWGNLIARLDRDENNHKTFGISTAGWDTVLTRDRLQGILSEGQKRHPILKKFDISKRQGIRLYVSRKLRKIDPEKSWHTHEWEEVCPVPETMYRPTDIPKGKMPKYSVYIDLDATLKENLERLTGKAIKTTLEEVPTDMGRLEEVQAEIDAVESEILSWRSTNDDYTMEYLDVADRLGKRQRYEELLKQRDELMWRGNPPAAEVVENPKIPYTPPEAPDVEVKCPITGKLTWSCTRCALFSGRSEQFIECKAKKGRRYYLASTRDKRGTVWDTYVLPFGQHKAGIQTRAIGGD